MEERPAATRKGSLKGVSRKANRREASRKAIQKEARTQRYSLQPSKETELGSASAPTGLASPAAEVARGRAGMRGPHSC